MSSSGSRGPAGPTGPRGASGPTVPGVDGQDGDDGRDGAPGAPGAQGAAGTAGAAGVQGLSGPPGQDGEDGVDGSQGTRGATGATGAAGAAGANGTSFLEGSGVPGAGTGSTGDLWLNIDNGDVYSKVSSTVWSLIGNLKGPAGANGATGADGEDGAQGDPGPPGPAPGPWTSYTPVVAQGVTTNISKTVNYAKYTKVGQLVSGEIRLTMTGTGTALGTITVSLPVTEASGANLSIGGGIYSQAGTRTPFVAQLGAGTTTMSFINTTAGAVVTLTVGAGDVIQVNFFYEAL